MFHVRKAVPIDALGIAIVNVYTWKTTYSGLMPDSIIDSRINELKEKSKKIKTEIEQNDNFIVAIIDNTVVGFCIYGPSRNETFKDSGEIFALYVLKGFQGMGIGKALFLAGINEILDRGNNSMIVNCLNNNPSIAFYKNMGGKVVNQRHDEINGSTIVEDIIYFERLR